MEVSDQRRVHEKVSTTLDQSMRNGLSASEYSFICTGLIPNTNANARDEPLRDTWRSLPGFGRVPLPGRGCSSDTPGGSLRRI